MEKHCGDPICRNHLPGTGSGHGGIPQPLHHEAEGKDVGAFRASELGLGLEGRGRAEGQGLCLVDRQRELGGSLGSTHRPGQWRDILRSSAAHSTLLQLLRVSRGPKWTSHRTNQQVTRMCRVRR